MTSQLTVPKCEGPTPLPRDVLTCRVGAPSPKAQWDHVALLHLYPQLQFLSRRVIDPAQKTPSWVESSPWTAVAVHISHRERTHVTWLKTPNCKTWVCLTQTYDRLEFDIWHLSLACDISVICLRFSGVKLHDTQTVLYLMSLYFPRGLPNTVEC